MFAYIWNLFLWRMNVWVCCIVTKIKRIERADLTVSWRTLFAEQSWCITHFSRISATSYALNWPLTRYAKLQVAHTPEMPGTFCPPPWVSGPDMHHGTCMTHVSWCMPGSLTNGFLWSRRRGKRSLHPAILRIWQAAHCQSRIYKSSPRSLM